MQPNDVKNTNMMHSIKSMQEYWDSDDEMMHKKQDKKQEKCDKADDDKGNKKWSNKCDKPYEYKKPNKCMSEEMKDKDDKMMCKDDKMMCKDDKMMDKDDKMMYMHKMKDKGCEKPIMIGDKMPDMAVHTTMGKRKLPDDYLGKWLVLFSHPGDFTPVCTTEFVSFANNYDNFKQLGAELLGLSVDQVQPHMKWTQWMKENLCDAIPFPIIADAMGETAKKLGMVHSTNNTQTVRAVFIVDPKGTVRMILYYPAELGRNIQEIIRALAALQVADKNNVAMPANWPNNELIGEQVIVPPAKTEEEAKKNQESYCNYDWWFCYKNLEE